MIDKPDLRMTPEDRVRIATDDGIPDNDEVRSVIDTLILVAIFIAVIVLLFKQDPAPAVALGAALLIVYIPMSFYTDLWLYRRRQAKKLEGGGGKPKKGSA